MFGQCTVQKTRRFLETAWKHKGLIMRKHTYLTALLSMGAVVTITPTLLAQEQQADEETIDVIVVTGSRIGRDPNLGSPVPVQSVSSETIQLSGELDIADVINDIPALLGTTTGEGSVDGVFQDTPNEDGTGVGQNVLQLRGLGTERTLVLVNGRRHVAGVEGSQAVDIGSIPAALIERVEVLTGGASAIYGADAVTGVVNFVLKDSYEGLDLDIQTGMSARGDAETYAFSGLWGKNFDQDRGNVTIAVDVQRRSDLTFQERGFSRNNGLADDLPNPALNFQRGDINPTDTPNFSQFFNPALTGRYPVGFGIPTADEFITDFTDEFGSAPNLTAAELALIDRAANAPLRAIRRQPTFSISSNRGVIAPSDFGNPNVDLNGNGVADCLDSSVGFNSSLDFTGFGIAGGCWVVNDDGSVRPYQDGLVSGVFNQFDGDGIQNNFDPDKLLPEDEKISVNINGRYSLTDSMRLFGEAKYVTQKVEFGGPLNTFYDLLTVLPDNPFIPAELQQLAIDSAPNDEFGNGAGLYITRDPTDLGPDINQNDRTTVRFVAGIEGELENGMTYEFSANYGQFEREFIDRNAVIQDRWFAAIDVTTDAAGNPICRSDIDPTPPATTPFDIPLFDPGFFTFNPGDGQCRPANILAGPGAISQEAIDFITTTVVDEFEIEQTVFSGIFTGETEFGFSAGGLGYAFGGEYREEESTSTFDPLNVGILPVTTDFGNAGDNISDLTDFRQDSLVFDPSALIQNANGSYDVWEVFGEVNVPLLRDTPGARELDVSAALRYSDYSTIGETVTWNAGVTWAPIDDLRFRLSRSRAIRAPNVFELFSPELGAFFRPNDPCDQAAIDALIEDGDARAPIREANCRADGIPQGYEDPLSARFSGVVGGNPDLTEEEGDTFSVGFVFQPRFLEGLTLSVDYWDIEITDAISSVDEQDIVDSCYDSANFPNEFCGFFGRNQDPTSAQFLGFNFLRQTQINLGKLESAGVDFTAQYGFDIGENDITVGVAGSWVDNIDLFFDPGDPSFVDPELGEIQRPELAGNINLTWRRGPIVVAWQTQYQDEQGLRAVEIEDVDFTFGAAGIADEVFIHDLSFSYIVNETVNVYGGVNNLGDELPFITEQAFPVSPRGRSFFVGVNVQLNP